MADVNYISFRNQLARANIDWLNATIKVALMTPSYTPDATADRDMADINTNEITGTNYTGGHGGSGRKTVTNASINLDTANNEVELDGDDPFWSDINPDTDIAWAVIHVEGSSDDTDAYLIGAYDVSDVDPAGNDYTLRFDTEGAVKLTTP